MTDLRKEPELRAKVEAALRRTVAIAPQWTRARSVYIREPDDAIALLHKSIDCVILPVGIPATATKADIAHAASEMEQLSLAVKMEEGETIPQVASGFNTARIRRVEDLWPEGTPTLIRDIGAVAERAFNRVLEADPIDLLEHEARLHAYTPEGCDLMAQALGRDCAFPPDSRPRLPGEKYEAFVSFTRHEDQTLSLIPGDPNGARNTLPEPDTLSLRFGRAKAIEARREFLDERRAQAMRPGSIIITKRPVKAQQKKLALCGPVPSPEKKTFLLSLKSKPVI